MTTDGSTFSDRALPYAAGIARTSGGTLQVLFAVGEHLSEGKAISAAKQEAIEHVQRIVDTLNTNGVNAEALVVEEEPGEAIITRATDGSADLLVIATHGRSGLGKLIYGSVTEKVIAATTTPLMVIPAQFAAPVWSRDRKFRIVVPLDGSPTAEAALPVATDLARLYGAEIVLMRVVEPAPYSFYAAGEYPFASPGAWQVVEQEQELLDQDAQDYVNALQTRLTAEGLTVSTRVANGFPASSITDAAAASDGGLVVMATHGRTGLKRVILGSVASGVIQRSVAPVLMVRPGELKDEEQPAS